MKWLVILSVALIPQISQAQKFSITELESMLDLSVDSISSKMKINDYRLMEKQNDNQGHMYYYSNYEDVKGNINLARSVIFMEAVRKDMKSRLVSYRTYNDAEYKELVTQLVADGYRMANEYDFKNAYHRVYQKDAKSIRLITASNKLKTGQIVKYYEFEIGK